MNSPCVDVVPVLGVTCFALGKTTEKPKPSVDSLLDAAASGEDERLLMPPPLLGRNGIVWGFRSWTFSFFFRRVEFLFFFWKKNCWMFFRKSMSMCFFSDLIRFQFKLIQKKLIPGPKHSERSMIPDKKKGGDGDGPGGPSGLSGLFSVRRLPITKGLALVRLLESSWGFSTASCICSF